MKLKLKLSRKGSTIGLVFGIIVVSLMIPLIYTALRPVYTISVVSNETATMAATPVLVNLAHMDIVPGSETVYNATNATLTVKEGAASAADCGSNVAGENNCYYNLTDGNKYTYAQIVVNQTGDFNISYRFYPPAYSKNPADRSTVLFIGTMVLLGAIVTIAKFYGLM